MKIAILSDIHGNHVALKAVIKELKKEKVNKIILLGDYIGYYYNPDKVLKILDKWDTIMIKGNHEEYLEDSLNIKNTKLINKKYGLGMVMAIKKLTKKQKQFLINLPISKHLKIDNLNIALGHGSPMTVDEYIYPNTSKLKIKKIFNKKDDFVFIGHSHHSFIFKNNKQILVNVGSVGQSRDKGGIANWALLDTLKKNIHLKKTPYDTFQILKELTLIDSKYEYNCKILHRNIYNNILVTGCGGDIGQSIGKIIKNEKCTKKIIGCDLNNFHSGKFIFDKCEIIPKVKSKTYLKKIREIIGKYNIELIIPISEAELRFFTDNKISSIDNVPLIMANYTSRIIGFDKYKTYNFLKKHNLPHPWTLLANKIPTKFPCILKSRTGKGSQNIEIISAFEKTYDDKHIFQELIPSKTQEYTCGVYRSKENKINTIIFKRKLLGGYTNYGEVKNNKVIQALLSQIATKINLKGSINVQLILYNKIPYVFEINPRFSSTVLFRHMFKFKDVIWQIQESKNLKLEKFKQIKSGKIYKGYQEYICADSKNITINNINFNLDEFKNENTK